MVRRIVRVDRPDVEKAYSFETATCGDPECGLHIIPKRRSDEPICEIVIGRNQLREVLAMIHDYGLDLP